MSSEQNILHKKRTTFIQKEDKTGGATIIQIEDTTGGAKFILMTSIAATAKANPRRKDDIRNLFLMVGFFNKSLTGCPIFLDH